MSKQNRIIPAGKVKTDSDITNLRIAGIFSDIDEIKNSPINSDGKIFRLAILQKFIAIIWMLPTQKLFHNSAKIWTKSIGEFVETLILEIVIVLGISSLSLGLRTSSVVAGCIPLVLAGTLITCAGVVSFFVTYIIKIEKILTKNLSKRIL